VLTSKHSALNPDVNKTKCESGHCSGALWDVCGVDHYYYYHC